jgi:hypothetical protein
VRNAEGRKGVSSRRFAHARAAAEVLLALVIAACGSSATPSAPTPTLAAGEIAYAPPGAGLAGATTFTFTAQGFSASNGDHLAYTWDFGDGTNVESGATATHYYESAGTYVVSVVATGSGGLSAAARLDGLTVVSLSGLWGLRDGSGLLLAGSTYLTQDGPGLRGVQLLDCTYIVTGEVRMPRSITIRWSPRWPDCWYGEPAYYGIDFTGTADNGFTSFIGSIGYQPGARLIRCAGPWDCP